MEGGGQGAAHDLVVGTAGEGGVLTDHLVFVDVDGGGAQHIAAAVHEGGEVGEDLVDVDRFARAGNAHHADEDDGEFAVIGEREGIVAVGTQAGHGQGGVGKAVKDPENKPVAVPHEAVGAGGLAAGLGIHADHLLKGALILGVDVGIVPLGIGVNVAAGAAAGLPELNEGLVQLLVAGKAGLVVVAAEKTLDLQILAFAAVGVAAHHGKAGVILFLQFFGGEAGVGAEQHVFMGHLKKAIRAFKFLGIIVGRSRKIHMNKPAFQENSVKPGHICPEIRR